MDPKLKTNDELNANPKAVLDLGTNTFHLLIASVEEGAVNELYQEQIAVKIGAGGINQGFIAPDAYQRGMDALAKFHQTILGYDVKTVVATGTSAIRNAKNGGDFLTEARARFGFEIKSISGDREAELIYNGVSLSFNFPDEPILVMDIGGGSVEFIIGVKGKILWKQSFEIGAARLLDKFKPSNPISASEISAIEMYLSESLIPLEEAMVQVKETGKEIKTLVGSAGSFETLLDVLKQDLGLKYQSISSFAHEVSMEDAEMFYTKIIGSTAQERAQLIGLLAFRVDMIVVASILMRFVTQNFGLNQLIASNYALKEGLLLLKE
jgi:exopolyphosphatase/guanosine-5'-triphosphate,3'-diphosphate pyrophosphatase